MTGADAQKAELRSWSAHARREARARIGDEAAGRMLALAFPKELAPPGARVAGYWPLGDEIDPRPLLEDLERRGCRLALPVVVAPRMPLVFRPWRSGQPLEAGPHHTRHPLASAGETCPDILLVPMLAFDAAGGRLGYGGGYYDRTLLELRARRAILAVGLAYSAQRVDNVPRADWDQRLDWIVTETGSEKARR